MRSASSESLSIEQGEPQQSGKAANLRAKPPPTGSQPFGGAASVRFLILLLGSRRQFIRRRKANE
jgi:hypothetical protein